MSEILDATKIVFSQQFIITHLLNCCTFLLNEIKDEIFRNYSHKKNL